MKIANKFSGNYIYFFNVVTRKPSLNPFKNFIPMLEFEIIIIIKVSRKIIMYFFENFIVNIYNKFVKM